MHHPIAILLAWVYVWSMLCCGELGMHRRAVLSSTCEVSAADLPYLVSCILIPKYAVT